MALAGARVGHVTGDRSIQLSSARFASFFSIGVVWRTGVWCYAPRCTLAVVANLVGQNTIPR